MRHMSGRWSRRLVAVAVPALLVAGCSPAAAPPAEAAYLCPTNSPENWDGFVRAAERTALKFGVKCRRLDEAEGAFVFEVPGRPLVVRCARELGRLHMRRRVRQLCDTAHPVALIGGGNSGLARAIAEELEAATDRDHGPALLLTYASMDALAALAPGRNFRFCHSNSWQAEAVVARLKQWLLAHGQRPGRLHIAIARVADNPFACDLAKAFERELRGACGLGDEAFCHPLPRFGALATETGGYDEPTDEEAKFAKCVAEDVAARRPAPYVLALAAGSKVHRRLAVALNAAFDDLTDLASAARKDARGSLVVLAGDSLDAEEFRNPLASGFRPKHFAGATIFFAANGADPKAHSIDLDIAAALLASWRAAEGPAGFRGALAAYRRDGDPAPMFVDGARRDGGGTICATPKGDAFDLAYLPYVAGK